MMLEMPICASSGRACRLELTIIFWLVISWAIVTVLGHGTWVLLAAHLRPAASRLPSR